MPTEKTPLAGNQTDLESTPVDRACRLIREFQAGKTTLANVRLVLREVSSSELSLVAIGTRVPLRDIQALKG